MTRWQKNWSCPGCVPNWGWTGDALEASFWVSVWCHIFHIFILFVGEFHWLKWSSSIVLYNVPQPEGCECLPEEVCVRGASFRRELQCWCEFSSVQSLSCIWLCDPMKCSVPGFPVLHQLLGLVALMSIESVMPSNCLIPSSPSPAFSLFPASGSFPVFSVSESITYTK